MGLGRSLKKRAKKLGRSTSKIVKKAVRNPLAVFNPGLYTAGASIGAPVGAAAGRSASGAADLGGSGAVLGGAAVATAGVLGGSELGGVADSGKSLFSTGIKVPDLGGEGGELDLGAYIKFGLGALGFTGGVDAAASAETAAAYNSGTFEADDDDDAGDLMFYALLGLAGVAAVVVIARAAR